MIQMLGLPFLACLAMTLILCPLGVHVLKREVIFIDIALAQIAAMGAIVGHLILQAHSSLEFLFALGMTVVAAGFFAFVRNNISQISLEAVIGISYALAAGFCLFLLGLGTGGHVHAQHMLAGSLLWITLEELVQAIIIFAVSGAFFWVFRRPFGRISQSYDEAAYAGLKVARWDFLFYCLFGLVITMAAQLGGVVLVFAFLILPTSAAALIVTSTRLILRVAWAVGFIASIGGLFFSYTLDFSVGPSIGLFLGLLVIVAGVVSALKRKSSHETRLVSEPITMEERVQSPRTNRDRNTGI